MGSSAIRFEKYEGLGNDFLVVDADDRALVSAEVARALCDRHRGVGADGVLLVLPGQGDRIGQMVVLNADGSVPEMCGNGLRCAALHLARRNGVDALAGIFDTDAGPRSVAVARAKGDVAEITVDMGEVRALERRSLEVAGERVDVYVADAGNPHAILLPAAGTGFRSTHDRSLIERLGPHIERHPSFPRGTNVELVSRHPSEKSAWILTVWERGVGFTEACGTGACATVATLLALGECNEDVTETMHLPGGPLRVTMKAGRAQMIGPARHVFSGTTS